MTPKRATGFWISYSLIFAACIFMAGVSNNWTRGSVIFGAIWGALCMPGWGLVYCFVLDMKDKWL